MIYDDDENKEIPREHFTVKISAEEEYTWLSASIYIYINCICIRIVHRFSSSSVKYTEKTISYDVCTDYSKRFFNYRYRYGDDYGQSADRLATTGVGPCVGFVVILNHGQNIFIEHLSELSLFEEMNLENVRSCLKNVAKHVFEVLPTSSIT